MSNNTELDAGVGGDVLETVEIVDRSTGVSLSSKMQVVLPATLAGLVTPGNRLPTTSPRAMALWETVVEQQDRIVAQGDEIIEQTQRMIRIMGASDAASVTAPDWAARGTNLAGMEMDYAVFVAGTGPIEGTHYTKHDPRIIDYLLTKGVGVIRLMVSWEALQDSLGGTVPATTTANYTAYYTNMTNIVTYATARGMTVIIELWQSDNAGNAGGARYRGDLVDGGVVTNAHFADFWSKMATIFASNPLVQIGLVNEPHGEGTLQWFATAQACITAIRAAGFTNWIHIPGNGYSSVESWTDSWYDTDVTPRSNGYGWLNANGVGSPLSDPLSKLLVEVHLYVDDAGGNTDTIVAFGGGSAANAARDRAAVTVDWCRTNGLKCFIAEVGIYQPTAGSATCWRNFCDYVALNADVCRGFAWWACGAPLWWDDLHGPHFSITPTSSYTVDTVNMDMIEADFVVP